MCMPSQGGRKENIIMTTEKFCVKCGRKFVATGREVICPECRKSAAEESKKAAVLRAKKASWTGESVPVRISGRASTVIREYGAAHDVPFAEALDTILRTSDYFASTGRKWEDVTPYKSHRRDKHTTETTSTAQDKQDATQASKPQDAQDVPQAAKTSKASATKSKTSATKSKASATAKRVKKVTGKE